MRLQVEAVEFGLQTIEVAIETNDGAAIVGENVLALALLGAAEVALKG